MECEYAGLITEESKLEVEMSESIHQETTLQLNVNQRTSEELAYFKAVIQKQLLSNLKVKRTSFVVSLGQKENADVVIPRVMPNEFENDPMRFVLEVICVPLLTSDHQFDRLEICWDPKVLHLNT